MTYNNIYRIAVLACTILCITSCHENSIIENDIRELSPLVINATPSSTRTTLDNDGKTVVWNANDEIAVYDYSVAKHRFVIGSYNSNKAQFIGKITAKKDYFIALYPHALGADKLSENNEVVATLPLKQNAAQSSFASGLNLSVAKGARNIDGSPSNVTFYNVCQLLKFDIPKYAAGKIKEITFTTNKPVAGTLNIDFSANTPQTTIDPNGSQAITILPPAGNSTFNAGTYYIVSAPVVLEGFSMAFTCDGTSYTLNSNSTFGGEAAKIYTLGTIDLVNTPDISAQHIYTNGILQGTKVTLSNAPIDGYEWKAVVKNSAQSIVRSIQGTGTLVSSEQDESWPYLPQGNYAIEYTYTTSNGKSFTKTQTLSITEQPQFTVSMTAYTSFSYYNGDVVEKNISEANKCNNATIYAPKIAINNISQRIIGNPNYSFSVSNTFNGTQSGYSSGVYTYNNYTVGNLGSYTLTGSVSFDGVTQSSSKTVHITGIPYTAAPPTQTDWTGNANSWKSDFVRLHGNTITKTFFCPENINVTVSQNAYVRRATMSTTYKLLCSGNELKSMSPGYMSSTTDINSYQTQMTQNTPTVSCTNSYGNPDTWISEGTNAKIYSITVQYR